MFRRRNRFGSVFWRSPYNPKNTAILNTAWIRTYKAHVGKWCTKLPDANKLHVFTPNDSALKLQENGRIQNIIKAKMSLELQIGGIVLALALRNATIRWKTWIRTYEEQVENWWKKLPNAKYFQVFTNDLASTLQENDSIHNRRSLGVSMGRARFGSGSAVVHENCEKCCYTLESVNSHIWRTSGKWYK